MSKKHEKEFPDKLIESAGEGEVGRFAWAGLDEIKFEGDEDAEDEDEEDQG